jgi:hypothetical protein
MSFSLTEGIESQIIDDNVNISFGINSWDPVHIIVEDKNGSAFSTPIRFTAMNSTYYSFRLVINFQLFENLSPRPPQREIILTHGINNLFTLSVHVPGSGYGYKYSYEYWLSPSSDDIETDFPYLIPLKEGKTVKAKTVSRGKMQNSFQASEGDTIFCMRRGIVTAVPRYDNLDFRISDHNSLEVLHEDGTIMIYHYLDNRANLCAPGKVVIPGQPVGLVSDSLYFAVTLSKISREKNRLISLPIKYAEDNNKVVLFDELESKIKVIHPSEIIMRELKGKEARKIRNKG